MTQKVYADGAIRLIIGAAARLEIHSPKRCNAVTRTMWASLVDACDEIAADDRIRVLVVCGAGEHFSAGADISEFGEAYHSRQSAQAYNGLVRSAEHRLLHLPQPVIASIRGACIGGGFGLAMSADLRFADTTAKFGVTASRIGLAYSPEDTAQLIDKIGVSRAKDMLFSGRVVRADEAFNWGLVDRCVTPDLLETTLESYCQNLLRNSRASIGTAKVIANRLSAPSATLCDELRPLYAGAYYTDDSREGVSAFLAKRDPDFG
jgi:enoyl-CoA hydratase